MNSRLHERDLFTKTKKSAILIDEFVMIKSIFLLQVNELVNKKVVFYTQ